MIFFCYAFLFKGMFYAQKMCLSYDVTSGSDITTNNYNFMLNSFAFYVGTSTYQCLCVVKTAAGVIFFSSNTF